ncbi:MAG: hypothetical protein HRT36_01110 [Alphaproteobacteria bacterium]|nr:hypothetical protein [Alphaproteobacteria bacterium]
MNQENVPKSDPNQLDQKTDVIDNDETVSEALVSMDLTVDGIQAVAERALRERSQCTSNSAANAPGTYAYHAGTRALRDVFTGANRSWEKHRDNNIEFIFNPELAIKMCFQNVDAACTENLPVPISGKKGSGFANAVRGMGNLFRVLPAFQFFSTADRNRSKPNIFWLAMDKKGRCEVSEPVLRDDGAVSSYRKRIFVDKIGSGTPDIPEIVEDSMSSPEVVLKGE